MNHTLWETYDLNSTNCITKKLNLCVMFVHALVIVTLIRRPCSGKVFSLMGGMEVLAVNG